MLITDGGDNSREEPVRAARILKSLDVPLPGVGQRIIEKDREIVQVSTSRTVTAGSIFDVNITVQDQGYNQRDVELIIEQGDKVVGKKEVKAPESGTSGRYTLQLTPDREGLLVYTVRIPEEPDDRIPENNRRTFLVNNLKKQADILYIEGHPRNEYKFIRRAVTGDQTLRLATYLQTGPRKFLRQGIDSPQELANGYPRKKEDLYRYEAILLGDIPKNFFTADQLAMTRDFVSERGGGFLMIGGATDFDEGFMTSPIAEIAVTRDQLPPSARPQWRHPRVEFALRLTGREQSAMLRMRLRMTNRHVGKMPDVQGINVDGRAKPGRSCSVHSALPGPCLSVIAHTVSGVARW